MIYLKMRLPGFLLLSIIAGLVGAADSAETVVVPAEPIKALSAKPLIALIIDDLGNQRIPGMQAVSLEGPVACAIMPHTAHSAYLAEQAYAAGKEVMLHLPMQPVEMERIAGPGEISLDNDRAELLQILNQDMQSVPHAVGINNHMGSLLTRHPGHMRWLMEEMASRGDLFFIDSYTTSASVALAVAVEAGVPAARRSIFLDNETTVEAITLQFERLKQRALKTGYAIGIGHPYPITLKFLETNLPNLSRQGFELVPVRRIVELQAVPAEISPEPYSDKSDERQTAALR